MLPPSDWSINLTSDLFWHSAPLWISVCIYLHWTWVMSCVYTKKTIIKCFLFRWYKKDWRYCMLGLLQDFWINELPYLIMNTPPTQLWTLMLLWADVPMQMWKMCGMDFTPQCKLRQQQAQETSWFFHFGLELSKLTHKVPSPVHFHCLRSSGKHCKGLTCPSFLHEHVTASRPCDM